MGTTFVPQGDWRKSSASGDDNCVEVAFRSNGEVMVRHASEPGGPVLVFTETEWQAFLVGVRNSEFELARE